MVRIKIEIELFWRCVLEVYGNFNGFLWCLDEVGNRIKCTKKRLKSFKYPYNKGLFKKCDIMCFYHIFRQVVLLYII